MTFALMLAVLAAEPPRLAVVVGSNSPVGDRPGLHFAHKDAQAFAQVLIEAGHFAKSDVAVLLDPTPADVLATLDQALARSQGGGLVVFYYSGHADTGALFPHGEPLALSELKTRLTSEQADIRIGIIDGCRGGGWTQAKGLSAAEPFSFGIAPLETEGTVLLASSSGLEDAHEAESLQGSFFTHHLVAGLRGAADQSHDGRVTLSEAFAYANQMTIRDTAQVAKVPQHPSFDMKLRGRQDLVLTAIADAESTINLVQRQGPLQVVQLDTGVVVAESKAGSGTTSLAVPAGEYLVRRVDDNGVFSQKVLVASRTSMSVDEDELRPMDVEALASKGVGVEQVEPPPPPLPPKFEVLAGANMIPVSGYAHAVSIDASFSWRLVRWLSWRPLRLSYQINYQVMDPPLYGTALATQFLAGTDAVFTFYRSRETASGFRFEGGASIGPTIASLADLYAKRLSAGLGGSLDVFADFRIPFLPDVHFRISAGEDVVWALAGQTTVANMKIGSSLSWRFGQ